GGAEVHDRKPMGIGRLLPIESRLEVMGPRLVPRYAEAEGRTAADRDDAHFIRLLLPDDRPAVAPHVHPAEILDTAMEIHVGRQERTDRPEHDGAGDHRREDEPAATRQHDGHWTGSRSNRVNEAIANARAAASMVQSRRCASSDSSRA